LADIAQVFEKYHFTLEAEFVWDGSDNKGVQQTTRSRSPPRTPAARPWRYRRKSEAWLIRSISCRRRQTVTRHPEVVGCGESAVSQHQSPLGITKNPALLTIGQQTFALAKIKRVVRR
jgi:hypothetical protein